MSFRLGVVRRRQVRGLDLSDLISGDEPTNLSRSPIVVAGQGGATAAVAEFEGGIGQHAIERDRRSNPADEHFLGRTRRPLDDKSGDKQTIGRCRLVTWSRC